MSDEQVKPIMCLVQWPMLADLAEVIYTACQESNPVAQADPWSTVDTVMQEMMLNVAHKVWDRFPGGIRAIVDQPLKRTERIFHAVDAQRKGLSVNEATREALKRLRPHYGSSLRLLTVEILIDDASSEHITLGLTLEAQVDA